MDENDFLLDLILYRPKAFLLLSYLKLISEKKCEKQFHFSVCDIREIGSRVLLTKDQVRRNLVLLEERKYITTYKPKYPRKSVVVTILDPGGWHG